MSAFLFVACGGDDNKASDPDPSAEADFVVDSFGDLSICNNKREGVTAYVEGEDNAYICTDGDWTIDTNADTRKKPSNSKDDANSSNSKDKAKSSSSRCEDCKDEAKSGSSSAESSSSRYEDCKDEANSNSNFAGQKKAWEYLSPNIDYGEMVDDRDCQTYKTVKIGNQVWMAENLNYATAKCSYCYGETASNPKTENCTKYGRLYAWAVAIDVCPLGWHSPDTTEWLSLFTAVGGKATAGKILKSQTGWNDYNGTSRNGTDAYGFSAFPAGSMNDMGDFNNEGNAARFWSATELGSNTAYFLSLVKDAVLDYTYKGYAFSVRCVRDESSSGSDEESSSSEEFSSSSEEKSSSSISPFSSDGCIYDATANSLTDLRDGQVYSTTTIDIPSKNYSEVWMAENLNLVTENSWCGGGHDYEEGDCSVYGRLYTWAAAVAKPEDECGYGHECGLGNGDIRGACPKGWHVPSESEWNDLFTAVGGPDVAGKVLKSETGWQSYSGIENSDTYLFSALPAGYRDNLGNYDGEGGYAHFWSSTEISSQYAYLMYFFYDYDNAYLYYHNKYYVFSVRCLKD